METWTPNLLGSKTVILLNKLFASKRLQKNVSGITEDEEDISFWEQMKKINRFKKKYIRMLNSNTEITRHT